MTIDRPHPGYINSQRGRFATRHHLALTAVLTLLASSGQSQHVKNRPEFPPTPAQVFIEPLGSSQYRLVATMSSGTNAGPVINFSWQAPGTALYDDGTHGDLKAGDSLYSTELPLTPELISGLRASTILQKAAEVSLLGKETEHAALTSPMITLGKGIQDPRTGRISPTVMTESFSAKAFLLDPARATTPLDDDRFAERCLMINHIGVVEDKSRVFDLDLAGSTPGGVWSFQHLMEQLFKGGIDSNGNSATAEAGRTAADFVEEWLTSLTMDQTINRDPVKARGGAAEFLKKWKGNDKELNLSKSPFRLMAILARFDLIGTAKGNCGECRFVFCALEPGTAAGGTPVQTRPMTVIFEYAVAETAPGGLQQWAKQWLSLAEHEPGTPAYNQQLEKVTEIFVRPSTKAIDSKINVRSFLSQLRTNEIAFASPWELREWGIDSRMRLVPADVKQTPSILLNSTARLTEYLQAEKANLEAGTHFVPLEFPSGSPFAAGFAPVPTPAFFLNGAQVGAELGKARRGLSFSACSGCHASETQTVFTHIGNPGTMRRLGEPAFLSAFLRSKGPAGNGSFQVADPAGLVSEPNSFRERTNRREAMERAALPKDFFNVLHNPTRQIH